LTLANSIFDAEIPTNTLDTNGIYRSLTPTHNGKLIFQNKASSLKNLRLLVS